MKENIYIYIENHIWNDTLNQVVAIGFASDVLFLLVMCFLQLWHTLCGSDLFNSSGRYIKASALE